MSFVDRRPHGLDMAWADQLLSPVASRRAAALAHFAETEARCAAAREARQRLWKEFGHPTSPDQIARQDQATTELQVASQYSLVETVVEFRWYGDDALVHPALLWLEWEQQHPSDWSPAWGLKAGVLKALAHRSTQTLTERARLQQLVLGAAGRAHRCEDQGYARLARAVDDGPFRTALTVLAEARWPASNHRARYLLAVLADPALPATVAGWKQWLVTDVYGDHALPAG